MESKESQRRLAAIMFTDIVSYTAMMQHDEPLAMAAVRKHHEALQQCVPEHGGNIHQYFGDGSLSIFNSATDAVQCAFEFQKHLLEDPAVPVRIGIHIGEIHTEDGKIFGDGVNVASRIESIGQGGTVLFSRDVHEKIRNRPEFQIRSIGAFEFKNVDDPIEVFALINPEIRTPDPKAIEGKLKEHGKRKRSTLYLSAIGVLLAIVTLVAIYLYPKEAITAPDTLGYKSSVAVLPFANLSENPEESSFLSTGLAEDILTQLAKIKDLKVISRSSSMKYKDYEEMGMSLRSVAKELGVSHILEGTVRKYGNQLRISIQLVDPDTEILVWAEDFDSEIADILNVQRKVALEVSEKLEISLSPELKSSFENTHNVAPEAYLNYHKGQEILHRTSGSQEEINMAMTYFENAIAIDPNYSQAWVGLADAALESVFWHRATDGDALPNATKAANKALSIDPNLGEAFGALGAVDLYKNAMRSAKANLMRAIELSPNYAFAYERLAWVELYTDNTEQGFALLEKVIQLDPLSTRYRGSLGNAYYMTERYEEGVSKMETFLRLHPNDNFLLWTMAYLLAGKGEYQKAIEHLDKRTIGKGTNWLYAFCYSKLDNTAAARKILDQLLEKTKTSFVPDFMLAATYAANGMKDEAIHALEHASLSGGESFFAWQLGTDPMFASLRGDRRFEKIVEQIRKEYKD